ncbi:ParM/StbA family protein [Clostridium botulinum]|uniref:ParM/StbA family protein n=1 Tax=Clostridium botulinum TaxID=1491 RepID=UPI0004CFF10F|nr:ParM/StbA family protein [Clostridium botulinum]MBY6773646.1 ParM/StbA family protein [Clostridium botulinum]MBY6864246.1 ParM/StbA family protein [Clostridium botulinum]MBY6984810.1 ParM/StbA family protein [Clostridium botulinum]NFP26123.1 ParM/StbA family protein [Clostridium botulinum]
MDINVKVGNDNGNSEQDIIINGEQICQPNVCCKIRKLPLLDEVSQDFVSRNIHDNLIVTIDSPSCNPGIYYVGKYALKSREAIRNIEVGVDNSKVDSDIIVINTLAQIAGYAAQKGHEKNETDIKVKVEMTTALPIGQYSKENSNKFSNKFTKDKHKITVHIGTKRVNIEIQFEFVKVIPEGVTAVHALQNISTSSDIFKEFIQKYKLEIDKDFFKNKRILHIAIGEGTTEYPITKDIIFNPNFIKGSNNGIGHAIDKALDEFKEEWGLLNYSRQKYSEVLRDNTHKYFETASDIVSDYIEEEAEDILHYAKGEIQKANNEVDIICVYGGGSILMRKYLENRLNSICEKANIKLLYIPEKFAVTLESKGMYYFTESKLFDMLKQKHLKEKAI